MRKANPGIKNWVATACLCVFGYEPSAIAEDKDNGARVGIGVEAATEHRAVGFRDEVMPVLSKLGCNAGACHGNLNGKGGFRLSLRGEDPDADLLALTRDTSGRRIDRARPEASLLLRKPSGRVVHEGGLRLPPGSPEYATLRDWIAQGARDDSEGRAELARIAVEPAERVLERAPGASGYAQQLKVTAEFEDGTRRDVTRQAAYELSDPTRAGVDADGRVTAVRAGEVAVAIRFGAARATSRLAFLADRPGFVWDGPEPANVVDEHVFRKLKALRINPSRLAGDAVFVRRVYLDTIGVPPTAEEARAFLADTDPEKRARLIDRLLERPEFAEFWALKWADLLRNEEKTMGFKGVWGFQRWLRDQVAADAPLDEFARSLISARGSTWKNPPASFFRTNRDPQAAAEAVGQVFMGVRLQCARCHNHPFDVWTQDDYYGLAAAFANLDRKVIDNKRRDGFDKHEINGDVVIYASGAPGMVQPRSGEMMAPRPPGGPKLELPEGDPDARDELGEWITRENRRFARVMANRVWFHLTGRGIVEPVDDFRDSNPPSDPELLDVLADALVDGRMRLRPLARLILNSRTYQLDAIPNATNADDELHFSRSAVKLLPAEVLIDAVSQALDTTRMYRGAPDAARASQLPGVRAGTGFLKTFGKPDRLLTCECERSDATTLAQSLALINGDDVRRRIEDRDNRIGRLIEAGASDETIIEELYYAALSRDPNVEERTGALEHLRTVSERRRGLEDLAWALINSKEFLLRH